MAVIAKVAVAGAEGRMGRAVVALARSTPAVELTGVFGRDEHRGRPLDDLILGTSADALAGCDVIIDFSTAPASARLAAQAAGIGRPGLVLGATGFSAEDDARVRAAAGTIPIVRSGNYSIGVNILAGLVEQTARRLDGTGWDIEIFEAHHRRKRDAPSGTAFLLAEAAARGRGVTLAEAVAGVREGAHAPRAPGTIGVSVMRGGGIVGEHRVVFAAEEEILTLSHSALDRRLFARGAIEAAIWLIGRDPGLYDMADVLGLRA
jgi:4-hydroxy-tetrahydrodipicolinate reductase